MTIIKMKMLSPFKQISFTATKIRNASERRFDANRFPLIREIFFWSSIASLCILDLPLLARLMSFLAIKTPVAHN
jgi:hypothetical protein